MKHHVIYKTFVTGSFTTVKTVLNIHLKMAGLILEPIWSLWWKVFCPYQESNLYSQWCRLQPSHEADRVIKFQSTFHNCTWGWGACDQCKIDLMFKVKLFLGFNQLITIPWRCMRSRGIVTPFLTSVFDGDGWLASRLFCLNPFREMVLNTHCTGGLMCNRCGVNVIEKRRTHFPCRFIGLPARIPFATPTEPYEVETF
jgi:hypothetical protein